MADDRPTPPEPSRAGMGRGLRVLLFASLALNLLIAGIVIGALATGRIGDRPRMDLNLGPFLRAMSEEDRRAIVDRMRRGGDLRPVSPAERRRDLVAMIEVLRGDPFDAGAMTALLAEQRAKGARVVGAAHAAFVARLETLSPAERAAFADRLEDELRHRHHRPPGAPDSRRGD